MRFCSTLLKNYFSAALQESAQEGHDFKEVHWRKEDNLGRIM